MLRSTRQLVSVDVLRRVSYGAASQVEMDEKKSRQL